MEYHMLCGIPGSGKSTLVQQLDGHVVSTDSIRKFLWQDEAFMKHDQLVFRLVDEISTYMLSKNRSVIFDATNLVRKRRRKYIKMAKSYGAVVILHWVNTPLKMAVQRNFSRDRQVPLKVIEGLYLSMQKPSLSEGMDMIRIYNWDLSLQQTIRQIDGGIYNA